MIIGNYIIHTVQPQYKLQVRDDVPMTDLARAKMNLWLFEMFGHDPICYQDKESGKVFIDNITYMQLIHENNRRNFIS